ncbi:MAG: hypothetical protein LBB81_05685 [Treponema sp.]|nr:hypothetical protein [Treponema sp.]
MIWTFYMLHSKIENKGEAIINFFLGLIASIGFYFLFYKLNKPAARWRSVALMAVSVLG